MYHTAALLSIVGIAMTAPHQPRAEPSFLDTVCNSPESNCEVVVKNGYKTTQFKEGMGPGSEHYKRTIGSGEELARKLRRRDDDDDGIKSTVSIGKTEINWGCPSDGSDQVIIADWLDEALGDLCSSSGSCDEGSEKEFDTFWVDKYSDSVDGKMVVTADGSYPPEHAGDFKDALLTIPEHGKKTSMVDYFLYGAIPTKTSCRMSRMANFGAVVMYDGMNQVGDMSFKGDIEVTDAEDTCEFINAILGSVGGAVDGIAGGFFGIVSALCASAEEDPDDL